MFAFALLLVAVPAALGIGASIATEGDEQDPSEGFIVEATWHAAMVGGTHFTLYAVQLSCTGAYFDPSWTSRVPRDGHHPDAGEALPPNISVRCQVRGAPSMTIGTTMPGYAASISTVGLLTRMDEVCWEGAVTDPSGKVRARVPLTCEGA